jgi:hypothetical protein
MPTTVQVCRICKVGKPTTEFYKRTNKTGHRTECKDCRRKYGKLYRLEHKAEIANAKKMQAQLHPEKVRARRERYKRAHPDRVRATQKRYAQVHPENGRFRQKRYRKAHPDRVAAKNKRWTEGNLEHIIAYRKRYRQTEVYKLSARVNSHNQKTKRAIVGHLSLGTVQQVYEDNIKKYGTLTCELCFDVIVFGNDSIEHSIPIVRGGTHERSNLGVAHLPCNLFKGRMTLDEWFVLHSEYKERRGSYNGKGKGF